MCVVLPHPRTWALLALSRNGLRDGGRQPLSALCSARMGVGREGACPGLRYTEQAPCTCSRGANIASGILRTAVSGAKAHGTITCSGRVLIIGHHDLPLGTTCLAHASPWSEQGCTICMRPGQLVEPGWTLSQVAFSMSPVPQGPGGRHDQPDGADAFAGPGLSGAARGPCVSVPEALCSPLTPALLCIFLRHCPRAICWPPSPTVAIPGPMSSCSPHPPSFPTIPSFSSPSSSDSHPVHQCVLSTPVLCTCLVGTLD